MSSKSSRKRREDEEDYESAKKPRKNEDSEQAEEIPIEETNRIRISLGLAPLEETDKNKVKDAEDGSGEKIYNEDGFEFRHRKAENLSKKKDDSAPMEKLEVSKQKREVYNKVLKAKKLADSSDDEDDAKNWIEKMRQKDEEARKAAEREKAFNQLDDELGVSSTISTMRKKVLLLLLLQIVLDG